MCSCVQMNTWLSIFCVDIAVILENTNIRLDSYKATITRLAVAKITFTVLLSLETEAIICEPFAVL